MKSNAELQELFSKPEYSDLTIKLSDGQELRIHKVVVCTRNEYFLKLCGSQSHFAESQEKVIQLKDDDPTALEHVIRHLYGFDIPQNKQSEWRFWLNLHVTADKYLVPKLSEVAGLCFRSIARNTESIDDIIDILETIRIEMGHDIELVELAARLRKEHIGKLLSNDRYRAQLDSGGMDALWQQLDELNTQMLARTEMSYQLCPDHRLSVFQPPVAKNARYRSVEDHCTCCSIYHDGVGAGAGRNVYKDYAQDSDEDTMMEVCKAWIE